MLFGIGNFGNYLKNMPFGIQIKRLTAYKIIINMITARMGKKEFIMSRKIVRNWRGRFIW
jgi:hypothetical protein